MLFFLWLLKRKKYFVVLLHEAAFAEHFSLYSIQKHHCFWVDKNKKKVKSSKFLYLPSTFDRKEDFLNYKDHMHLHPNDIS